MLSDNDNLKNCIYCEHTESDRIRHDIQFIVDANMTMYTCETAANKICYDIHLYLDAEKKNGVVSEYLINRFVGRNLHDHAEEQWISVPIMLKVEGPSSIDIKLKL